MKDLIDAFTWLAYWEPPFIASFDVEQQIGFVMMELRNKTGGQKSILISESNLI